MQTPCHRMNRLDRLNNQPFMEQEQTNLSKIYLLFKYQILIITTITPIVQKKKIFSENLNVLIILMKLLVIKSDYLHFSV